ncbi:MAG: rhamnan synthesis F family protein, partial [Smithella sp.]
MSKKTIQQLYAEHTGKMSDKWSLYLVEYDRLFADYRQKAIRLFEIGIQNGGSLDIWSKYFINAAALIGCDINQDCARLSYDDSRIEVIIGDANDPDVRKRLFQRSPAFDIIIDDGSHMSKDIIKSFASYFPLIVDGGVFIVEDLHCSYWEQFEGGLHNPYSSVAFFKRLGDIVNYEHWRNNKSRKILLKEFATSFGVDFDENDLARIHSIEFVNSLCIIKKLAPEKNVIGKRIIAGSETCTMDEECNLNATSIQDITIDVSDDAHLDVFELMKNVSRLNQAVAECDARIVNFSQAIQTLTGQLVEMDSVVAERDGQIVSLNQTIQNLTEQLKKKNETVVRDQLIKGLTEQVAQRDLIVTARDEQIAVINQVKVAYSNALRTIEEIRGSSSWRITAPMRFVSSKIKNIGAILKLLPSIVRFGDGVVGSARKAWRVFSREGWSGVKRRILFVGGNRDVRINSKLRPDLISDAVDRYEYGEPVLAVPFGFSQRSARPEGRIAVILHAYYPHLAPEFRRYLDNICHPFDLFVSTDTELKANLLRRVFAGVNAGSVEVRVVPNRGRDIAPKLITFRDAYDSHAFVLHLHTKISNHNAFLAGWRGFVLNCLLGSPDIVESVLEAFVRMPQLGIVAPRNFPAIRFHMIWDVNFLPARALAARMGITITPDSPLDFPAGSMFWARSAALRPLLDLDLSFDDFSEEMGQTDGTLAHAVERLYFYVCEKAGFRWVHTGSSEDIQPMEWLLRANDPADLQRCVSDQMPALMLPGIRPRPIGSADEADFKQAFRDRCAQDIDAFLAGEERISIPVSDKPAVSVILVLFNQAELTFHCLQSLQFMLDVPAEVIIVDNASTDHTAALLDRVDGARILRKSDNLHFLRGVNAGAEIARGKHLLLLNNDTRVKAGSIASAYQRLEEEKSIGAVGGKIVLLDGTLQEAGSIIWRDGSCLGYGRGRDPGDAEFQFLRDVDYCSGCFLMVRRDLFERLRGFDKEFAPAYYEETDLCMRIRQAGFRVVYDPNVEVMHFEFGSSANSAFALQQRNRNIFTERHRSALAAYHMPSDSRHLDARMRMRHKRRVLVVDDRVPFPSLGAGYPRASHLLGALVKAGCFVTHYPLIFPEVSFAEAYALLPRELEIIAGLGRMGLIKFLQNRIGYYDTVIISRPHNMELFGGACRMVSAFLAHTPLIYDAEAVFAVREALR